MALGTSRTRNWGKDTQQTALDILLMHRSVAYKTTQAKSRHDDQNRLKLWLTPSRDGLTIPFTELCADLVNVCRGRWVSFHPYDGRLLATGISQRDVIRATIEVTWH